MSSSKGRDQVPEKPVGDLELVDVSTLLQAVRAASSWLDQHVGMINELNVFPVPDGDTGTNMSLTMHAALAEVETQDFVGVGELMRALAHGALMGARGNSGVILSQIFRGMAKALEGKQTIECLDVAQALREGALTAYKGVMKPVEGTMLTVIREAAEAAEKAVAERCALFVVLERVLEAIQASVARTPSLLPVLAEAGVVDAGGQGLSMLMEGFVRYLKGEDVAAMPERTKADLSLQPPAGQYNYDTQFIIRGEGLNVEEIRARISTFGDSVLVVGDERTVKVHVHSDHPGKVLEYGLTQGQLMDVVIENMQLQYEEFMQKAQRQSVSKSSEEVPQVSVDKEICLVAVVSGEGLKNIFESLGVDAIVPGGQTMNPSTQDLLKAVESVPCDQVILLPNNGNIILAAEQVKGLTKKRVVVVPTKTIPQGIAAVLSFNCQADLETNAEFMLEACKQVQTAEVTKAVRSVQVNGLAIQEGQFIGLLNGDLVTTDESISQVVWDLLERMSVAEYEVLTIYYGEDVSAEGAEGLAKEIERRYPELEIEVLSGGQTHYYYIISAE
ncbi:MAG: DAK2 domain-containing protein [Anaerolineae bacterium]|nr:DAK2 domain-containing protein [Anaerolineae bacterium]